MKSDVHLHTLFSSDSKETMENYCQKAIEIGVGRLCFTDHVDHNPHDLGSGYYKPDLYFKALEDVRRRWGKDIQILSGIEFSEPHLYQEALEKYKSLPYDFIIGSVHFWEGGVFPSEMPLTSSYVKHSFQKYWSEVLAMVRAGGFDSVGHLDFPKRYFKELYFDRDQMEAIFEAIVENDLVLEVNASSLRQGLAEPLPGPEFLAMYKAAGGTRFTLGSDAHRASDLYAALDTVRAIPEGLGLVEVYFKGRVPRPIDH